ncbi:cytochrome P450 [Arthrobacter sp. D1-29]
MTNPATTTSHSDVFDFPVGREPKCPFNPPAKLVESAAEYPVRRVRIWDGTMPWVITGNEELHLLATDPRVLAEDRVPGFPHWNEGKKATALLRPQSIFNTDGPEHSRFRRMTTRSFAFKRVESLRPRIQEITDERIDTILTSAKPVDLVSEFALPIPSLMICEMLGVPYEHHEFFQEHTSVSLDRYGTAEEQERTYLVINDFMRTLIESRIADPVDRGGVIEELVGHVRAGDISVAEAVQLARGLLAAGFETSANMIGLGTLALLQNPDQLAILRDTDDPKVIANAVEELLRYLSIVHNGQRRIAAADIEIAGQSIKAGEGIILDFSAGNWDARTFKQPDVFDIQRTTDNHLAFGFGSHGCIGQQLARAELQIVFSTLFRRIPTLKLAVPLDDIEFKHDRLAYGVYSLPVTW